MADPTAAGMLRRRRVTKTAFYRIDDEGYGPGPLMLGVIRCPDGDTAEYERLLMLLLNDHDAEHGDYTLAEPTWEWLRINPCASDEYSWMLGHAKGPGCGNFRGVVVREVDRRKLPVKRGREYESGPYHYYNDGCVDHV
jgi:hypothetical protein